MKKISFFTLALLISSSYVIATESKYEDEYKSTGNILPKERLQRIPAQFKEKIHQEIDTLWDENQTLWERNNFLETTVKEYERKLESVSIPALLPPSYSPDLNSNDLNEGQRSNEGKLVKGIKEEEKTEIPQGLNFLDQYFPLQKSMIPYSRSSRPPHKDITLKQFQQIQETIFTLLATNKSIESVLESKSAELNSKKIEYDSLKSLYKDLKEGEQKWEKEKSSLLGQVNILKTNKERAEADLKDLRKKIDDLTSKIKTTEEASDRLDSLNRNLQKNLKESQNVSQKLSEDIQNQKNDYEDSLRSIKRENEELEREKRGLESQLGPLLQEINDYKLLVSQGQKNLNKYLKEEEERRNQQIQNLFTSQKENSQTLKEEKSELERSNQQLRRDKEELERNLQKILAEKTGEKETLLNKIREESQSHQNSLLMLKQENTDLLIKNQQQANELLTLKQQKTQVKGENALGISPEKEQEYLSYLYQTIRKAKIPCPGKPKSLIEALDILQKSFEDS